MLDDKRLELSCGFLLLPSYQAEMVGHDPETRKVFFIFFPPASTRLGRDMINDDKNRNVAVAMFLPLVLQVLRSRSHLCWKILHADDSEADGHTRKLERGFSVVIETWDVVERDWDDLGRISELDVVGSHLPRASRCVI